VPRVAATSGRARGRDAEPPGIVEKNKSFPLTVLSSQCLDREYWTDSEALVALLDEVMKNYPVDPRRVYLTGHGMGGRGTWYLAYKHREKFAAIAAMSGLFLITASASRLKNMPIWAFHGAKDDIAPISEAEDMVKASKAGGNDVRSAWYRIGDTTFSMATRIRNFILPTTFGENTVTAVNPMLH
jgi:predicted peptidase